MCYDVAQLSAVQLAFLATADGWDIARTRATLGELGQTGSARISDMFALPRRNRRIGRGDPGVKSAVRGREVAGGAGLAG